MHFQVAGPHEGWELEAKIEHVHVVGAGVMGGDIAAWCGLRVTLQDLDHGASRPRDQAAGWPEEKLKPHRCRPQWIA